VGISWAIVGVLSGHPKEYKGPALKGLSRPPLNGLTASRVENAHGGFARHGCWMQSSKQGTMAWRSSGKLGWLFSTTTAGIAAVQDWQEVAVRAAKEIVFLGYSMSGMKVIVLMIID